MALRLRSFLPYTLPGFLAFIGWWWYASHKKGGINDHEKEKEDRRAPLGLLPPPDEGSSNGSLKNGDLNGTGGGRQMRKEEKPAETLPTEMLGMQDTPSQALCRKLNAERDPSDKGASLLASMDNSSHPLLPKTREKTSLPMRSEEADASASAIQQFPVEGQDVAAVGSETENVPLRSESPCTEISSPIKELVEAVRPEPEGEVATDKTSAPFAEKPQMLMENDSSQLLSSKDDQLQQLCPASPLALYLSSPVATTLVSQTEQGGLGEPRVNSQDAILAGDTITEVLTVECLGREEEGGESWPSVRCDGSLMTSKRSGTAQSQAKNEGDSNSNSSNELQNPLPGDTSGTRAAENWASTSGCSTPPVRMREMDSGGMCSELKSNYTALSEGGEEGASLNPATRRAEEGTSEADYSGCRTCQLEEGFGGEDLHSTVLPSHVVPDRNEDLMQLSVISQTDGPEPSTEEQLGIVPCEDQRLKGTGAQSGGGPQTNEAEEDPSGGSDSMDSGFMLGAGEGVLQGSQPMHSQFIVWELEVPKHLVGRLIGKQGRYVSFLKQSSGAKVYISTLPYTQEFQICHIEGSKQQVDIVLSLIGKKFKDLDLTNLHSPTALPHGLPSLPMTSWLLLPERVTVEVIVVNIVSAGHLFVQQHTHPTFHALRSLEEQMFLCYSQPGVPALPSVTEVGVICTAPASGGAWRRAQVIAFHKESDDVDIRYVDHGGYETVKINTLRQIRSDFVTLPFQGAEVLLDNLQPLPGENGFSAEAKSALEEMTRGVALLAQVTNYDNSGLPLIQMWNMVGDKMVSVNRTLAEHGFSSWVEMF